MGIENKSQTRFIFFALAKAGEGISGSDRIFIELARNWSKRHSITIYTSSEGVKLCRIQHLNNSALKVVSIKNRPYQKSFLVNYLFKVVYGIWLGLTLDLNTHRSIPQTIIYSSSEFWMDSLPGVLLKMRHGKKMKWVATWYQTAPNPLVGFAEGRREEKYRLSAFLYWFVQLPIKPLITKFADYVIVNNEGERKQFPEMSRKDKVRVLIGAVRLDEIRHWQSKHKSKIKKFDAVFQGRFHPQKGVVELMDIWKRVVGKMPNAKLAMIGDGPLMQAVRNKVNEYGLQKNISLFGYVYDGNQKYQIFSQSKLVVHPAFYDSGGMASAEAMAFGIPAVGFDLKAYESYYPQGMVRVKMGNLDKFADQIIHLLENDKYRQNVGREALEMVERGWVWKNRSNEILDSIL